jgi:hypothetical protein
MCREMASSIERLLGRLLESSVSELGRQPSGMELGVRSFLPNYE